MQDNKQKTIMFPIKDQNKALIRENLQSVYNSLKEKG